MAPAGSDAEVDAPPRDTSGDPVTIKLRKPLQLEKEIEELTIRFSSKALQGFTLTMSPEGGPIIDQYKLLQVGVRMAGLPDVAAGKFTHPKDAAEVAAAVLGFIV